MTTRNLRSAGLVAIAALLLAAPARASADAKGPATGDRQLSESDEAPAPTERAVAERTSLPAPRQ